MLHYGKCRVFCSFIFLHVCPSDSLAEHLQEIRVLRQRLEESINTNDRLREQLEKRLAEVEKDPGTRLKSSRSDFYGRTAISLVVKFCVCVTTFSSHQHLHPR